MTATIDRRLQLLTTAQAAEILGCSQKVVQGMCRRGELPAMQKRNAAGHYKGQPMRIRYVDLQEYIDNMSPKEL